MAARPPTLILVHEPERACLERLVEQGFALAHAREVASYLAQSTDIAPDLPVIAEACAARGLGFEAVELDAAAEALRRADPASTLVWTLTDGIAYFRGGAAPALARLAGLRTFGSDDSLFALCQDKFRSGAVLAALGLPVPPAGLARNGTWLAPPVLAADGWFVKPNRLGAKIGIWPDSRCRSLMDARALSRRIHDAYRDDALVQPYVGGRNVRASFLAVHPDAGVEALGVCYVESGGDFQTMADSMALYGEARDDPDAGSTPKLLEVEGTQPGIDAAIRHIAGRLMDTIGLKDVFSLDFRVAEDGALHLLEFEVCPGLPCFDFRAYCRDAWGMDLAEAIAETAARRLCV
jgi:D-alanine-D-alanine ligase